MKIKITHGQLQQLKDAATEKFKASHNQAVSAELFPVLCILLAFQDFVNRSGACIKLDYPTPTYVEPIEHE